MKKEMSRPFSIQSPALYLPHGLTAWSLSSRHRSSSYFRRALLHRLLLDLRQASDTTPPSVTLTAAFLISQKCRASRVQPRAFPSDPQPVHLLRQRGFVYPPGHQEHMRACAARLALQPQPDSKCWAGSASGPSKEGHSCWAPTEGRDLELTSLRSPVLVHCQQSIDISSFLLFKKNF